MLTAQRPCNRAVKRKANAGSISAYVLPAPSLACGVGFWAAAETRARGLRQQQIQAPISLASRRSRSIAALLQGIAPAWHIAWAVLGVAASPLVQAAAFTVGAGGAAYHGTIDLACDDLEVNGPLDASGALFTGVGRVRISAAGSIAAAGARIELGAGWHNAAGPAGFSGSGSTVAVVGRCSTGSTADITGNTTFVHLSAVQAGQTLRFAAGSEQQVAGTLTLNDVTLQGQGGMAFVTLLPGGVQQIGTVGVADVDASRGQRLAATGQNGLVGGNAPGWFALAAPAAPSVVAVPTLSQWCLLLLSAMAGLLGGRRLRAQRTTAMPPFDRQAH